MVEFERTFEEASVSGYMERVSKEIGKRLMGKGYGVRLVAFDGRQAMIHMSSAQGTAVFMVRCEQDDMTITWRQMI